MDEKCKRDRSVIDVALGATADAANAAKEKISGLVDMLEPVMLPEYTQPQYLRDEDPDRNESGVTRRLRLIRGDPRSLRNNRLYMSAVGSMSRRAATNLPVKWRDPCVADCTKVPLYDVVLTPLRQLWLVGPYTLHKALMSPFVMVAGKKVAGERVEDPSLFTGLVRFDLSDADLGDGQPYVTVYGNAARLWSGYPTGREQPATGRLAAATLVKYDWPYIRQWIDYHRSVGVEHFFVYNNGEPRISEAIAGCGCVTEVAWEYPYVVYPREWYPWWPNDSHFYTQPPAMAHCWLRYGPVWDWLLLIDCDEFVNPRLRDSLTHCLDGAADDVGAVSFMSQWYGDSGYDGVPSSPLTVYTRRERGVTGSTKVAVRPEAVVSWAVHDAELRPGWRAVHEPPDSVVINHYSAASDHHARRGAKALKFANEVEDTRLALRWLEVNK